MNLKHSFYPLLIPLLSGCYTYHHVVVQSDATINGYQEHIIKNDSVELNYSFTGAGGPVNIMVYNHSEKPVYVDWKKSAMIIDGEKYNYWSEDIKIDASSSARIQENSMFSTSISTEGVAYKDERISFIPPHSYIKSTRTDLDGFLKHIPLENVENAKKVKDGTNYITWYQFDEETSPVKFRSFLTLTNQENSTDETYVETPFWVKEVARSYRKNVNMSPSESFRPSSNGNSKESKNTTAIAGTSLFLLLMVALVGTQ